MIRFASHLNFNVLPGSLSFDKSREKGGIFHCWKGTIVKRECGRNKRNDWIIHLKFIYSFTIISQLKVTRFRSQLSLTGISGWIHFPLRCLARRFCSFEFLLFLSLTQWNNFNGKNARFYTHMWKVNPPTSIFDNTFVSHFTWI